MSENLETVVSGEAQSSDHKPKKPRKKTKEGYQAVGRRKTAIVRVLLVSGKGDITINGKHHAEYVSNRDKLIGEIEKPFKLLNVASKFNAICKASGGGIPAQAEAAKLAIARALLLVNPESKPVLSKAGCLVRDPRMKERKKYGQKKARKRFQYSKR